MIPVSEISAPNRTLEEYVAHECKALRLAYVHQMSWCVTGTVQHIEVPAADQDRITLPQPAVRDGILRASEAEGAGLILSRRATSQPLTVEALAPGNRLPCSAPGS